jgi:hypothetical protein
LTQNELTAHRSFLASARYLYPWLRHVFAEGGYSGAKFDTAVEKIGRWRIEIIKRSDTASGSSFCRGAGLSSAPWPGSIVTDASPKTLKPPWKALWRG